MNVSSRPFILASLICLVSTAALAQPRNGDKAEKSLVAPANLTFGATPTEGSAVQFILDASQDERNGTVAFGWKDGQGNFQISLTGPLSAKTATPVSLTGLSDGAIAKLSFSRLNWRGPTPLERLQIVKICQDAKVALDDCDVKKNKLPPLQASAVRQLQHLDDRIWFVSVDGSVGRSTFDFLNATDLSAHSENHQSWSGTGRIGYFFPVYGFVFGSYTYKRAYRDAADPKQICTPLGSGGALQCSDNVIGVPTLNTASIGQLELRRFFSTNAAITPSIQYDFKRKITAWEFPVYFIRVEKAGLSGGAKLAWRSDTKKTTALVFVGTAITLIPK